MHLAQTSMPKGTNLQNRSQPTELVQSAFTIVRGTSKKNYIARNYHQTRD